MDKEQKHRSILFYFIFYTKVHYIPEYVREIRNQKNTTSDVVEFSLKSQHKLPVTPSLIHVHVSEGSSYLPSNPVFLFFWHTEESHTQLTWDKGQKKMYCIYSYACLHLSLKPMKMYVCVCVFLCLLDLNIMRGLLY